MKIDGRRSTFDLLDVMIMIVTAFACGYSFCLVANGFAQ